MQRSLFFQNGIWNGFSSVQGIASTQMDQEQIEPPKLGIGKPLEKTEKWSANLIHPMLQGTARPWFSILGGHL